MSLEFVLPMSLEFFVTYVPERFRPEGKVVVRRFSDVQPLAVKGLEILVVGSPTQQFRPTRTTSSFLKSIPKMAYKASR